MASKQANPGCVPGKPRIRLIEAAHFTAKPKPALHAVRLEIADQHGRGFRAYLGHDQALDWAMRIVGAAARLRGGEVE